MGGVEITSCMIIYLHGADSFRSTKKLREIEEKFKKDVDPSGINCVTIDGTATNIADLHTACTAAPFLTRKRLLIIKNLITGTKRKELAEQVVSLIKQRSLSQSADTIVVFWEGDRVPNTHPLHKLLVKEKLAQEFTLLGDHALKDWIIREVRELGGNIADDAVREIALRVGPDLWRMHSELSRLAHYAMPNQITRAVVIDQVSATFDDSIFNLTDAIGNRQRDRALGLLTAHLAHGEHPLGIIAMLQKQYKQIVAVHDLRALQPAITKDALAKTMGIHPFVVQKLLASAQKYSPERARELFGSLVEMDGAIKRGESGELLLDVFVSKI